MFCRHWGVELKRRAQGRSARLWVALLMSILWRFILQGILISLEVSYTSHHKYVRHNSGFHVTRLGFYFISP